MTVTKEQLAEAARKDVREAMGWAEAQEWQYRAERDVYTPEELERVKSLQKQWTELGEQGQKEGWLSWSGGYDDGQWEVASNDHHPTRTVQIREDKEARDRRIADLDAAIEVKTAKHVERQWKALQDAQAIIARVAG